MLHKNRAQKLGSGKPGNNGVCGHKASMHPGSSTLLHPLLCGGTTAPAAAAATCCCFFLQRQTRQQHVRSAAVQVPSAARRVRLCCQRRPQALSSAAWLTNRREALPWAGPTGDRCAPTVAQVRPGVAGCRQTSPPLAFEPFSNSNL